MSLYAAAISFTPLACDAVLIVAYTKFDITAMTTKFMCILKRLIAISILHQQANAVERSTTREHKLIGTLQCHVHHTMSSDSFLNSDLMGNTSCTSNADYLA